jgi:hypothetical protein
MRLWSILFLSCRIFCSFGNPALEKLEFRLYPPLSNFDHLVSQVKITFFGSLLHYRFRIGSNQICSTIDVYIKAFFGVKNIFVYFVYYRYLESEKAKPLSDPRLL